MSQQEVDQLQVNKHFKIHSGDFKFDIHSSKDGIGFWLSNKNDKPGFNTIGAYIGNNQSPYFMIYPERGFWRGGNNQLPFAFTTEGIQVPHPDGTITHLSLRDISDLVKMLPKSN